MSYGRDPSGWVYLIGDLAQSDIYKVGCTAYLRGRLLDIASLRPIRLVWYILTNGARDLERHIHEMWGPCQVRGEWFRLDEPQVRDFKAVRVVNWKLRPPMSLADWPKAVQPRSRFGKPIRFRIEVGAPVEPLAGHCQKKSQIPVDIL